jgi:hypothetical protein
MKLINCYYDDITRYLSIEFALNEDGDDFYRSLELSYSEIELYSPDIIYEEDLLDIDKNFVKDLVKEYLKENNPPEQLLL